jgi:thymidine phosphorylase
MVAAQGGDPAVCERPGQVLPAAPVVAEVVATADGWVEAVPARAVGMLAGELGAGRARSQDDVDPAVGIELHTEVGARVARGDVLAVVHARHDDDAAHAVPRLGELLRIGPEPVAPPATELRVIGGPGVDAG